MPALAAVAPRAEMVRTVAQDQRGATFDIVPGDVRFDAVTVDGTAYTRVGFAGGLVLENPGRPSLPSLSLHVAIPDGMSPRLRIVSEEWGDRAGVPPLPVAKQRFISDDPKTGPISEFTTEPDPSIYRGATLYPAQAAELGAGAMVGEWWIAPIRVNPIRWDPRGGVYRVLRKMTVRVDFVAATDRELSTRPISRPGAQARAWDRVQRGLVKNYEAARAFPVRPRSVGLGAKPRPARVRFAVNPEWRLSVSQTGWTSVSYATLAASGFPSNIDIANVRVEERGYDDVGDSATAVAIPVVARDAGVIGKFDPNDVITFYARSLRDRYGTGNIELKYAPDNVYWLTWGSTPAPVPGTVSGVIGGAATSPTSFRDVIRLEENHAAMMAPMNTNNGYSPPEAIEYLFWTDGLDGDQFSTTIPFADPDPAQNLRIRARYQGSHLNKIHRVDTFFDGAAGTDTLAFDDEFTDTGFFPPNPPVYLLDTGFTIPGSHIGGANRFRHVGTSRNNFSQPPADPSYALLDVIEVTYNRLYKARSNVLRFTSGGTGGVFELKVDGFTSSTIEVYDLTDPLSPLRIPDASVTGLGPYSVRFRTDAAAGERRFIAFVPGAENALGGAAIVADAPSNLRVPGAYDGSKTARAIVITPELFFAEANRLANYRRAQGYVVEVAKIQDVYDEFNGGLKSPRAIRRYIRHGYLSWTPRPMYVILAGDGSLDYKHEIPSSGVDWIPTYMRFELISGSNGPEQVAQDPYYYAMDLSTPEPGSGSFVPNVALTRIPAGNSQELAVYVDKVIAYENFTPTDTWRGRQLLFSDDEYSTGISANQPYCFMGAETEFKDASVDMATITSQSPGGIGIQNDFFDLKTYTDAVPPNGSGCKFQNDVFIALGSPGGGYEQLRNHMGQGALVVNMETHGNRYLVAHEQALCSGGGVFCNSTNTPDAIQNPGRPFYLMIWGCHTNQFPDFGPYGRNFLTGPVDSLDALGEMFLFIPGRGSIASLGSTSLEFLQTNHAYNTIVANAFYTTPPTPPPPSGPEQARWILGEVMLLAQIENGSPVANSSVMNYTEHLFADPMLRMDALPPRAAQVMVDSVVIVDHGAFTSDLPTGASTILADLRDEVGIDSVYLTEQDAAGGPVTLIDTANYSVVYSDSSRVARLTANVRPRVANYDVQIRSIDINGRASLFTLEVRTPIHYFAGVVEIVNNTFVQSDAVLRAEVTSPIPLTADSLELVLDGAVVPSAKTQLDTAGRVWRLQKAQGFLTTATHIIQVAFNGRTAGFDQRTFQTTSEFTIRGVAVVDPRMQGAGCGGSIFQYELSASAQKVELLLMTVAGRRVASIAVPGQAGLNVYCWNGRDSESHDTAQGVYLYRIRATDMNGKSASKDGRLIRAR